MVEMAHLDQIVAYARLAAETCRNVERGVLNHKITLHPFGVYTDPEAGHFHQYWPHLEHSEEDGVQLLGRVQTELRKHIRTEHSPAVAVVCGILIEGVGYVAIQAETPAEIVSVAFKSEVGFVKSRVSSKGIFIDPLVEPLLAVASETTKGNDPQTGEQTSSKSGTEMTVTGLRTHYQNLHAENPVAQAARHSPIGISSFVVSITTGILLIILLVLAGTLADQGVKEDSPAAIIISVLIFFLLASQLVGLGLGIGSLFQKDRKRTFGVFGLIFSLLFLLGLASLLAFQQDPGGSIQTRSGPEDTKSRSRPSECADYYRAKKDLDRQQQKLLIDYPGTAVTLGACMGGCSGESDPASCALVACGLACIAIGFDNCANFFSETYTLEQYAKQVESLKNGCN